MSDFSLNVAKPFYCLYEPNYSTKVFYGGRGGAKSTSCAEALLIQGMSATLRILCVREIQKSIKLSVYSLLKDKIEQLGIGDFYTVKSDTIVGVNGTEFFFEGLQNHTVDSLKSIERINRCWVEEAHNVTDKSWEILLPSLFRISDFQLWITFNTRKVTDPTYIRFVMKADDSMLVKKISWRDNPWFPEGLNKQRLKLLQEDPEAYAHVWEGEPDTRHNGSVYARWVDTAFKSGRVVGGLYDPELPVNTAWDFGYSDNTSIIFWQQSGKETRIIDSYENFNEDIVHYCGVIEGKPYKYGTHFFPADAGNKLLASGGKSIAQIAANHGVSGKIIPETTHSNRIEAARWLLGSAYLDENCRDLINSLMNYSFEYNEELKIFSKKPLHDWSSHYSTAFELMARVVREQREDKKIDNSQEFNYQSNLSGGILGRIDTRSYFERKRRERE